MYQEVKLIALSLSSILYFEDFEGAVKAGVALSPKPYEDASEPKVCS